MLRETRVATVVAGLQLARLTGRLVRVIPSKILLLGCPNQSTKATATSNVGVAIRAVPGVCLPGRMPPPPEGALPPVPALEMTDSRLEGLESKQNGLESPLELFNKGSIPRSQQAILSHQKA